MTRGTFVTSFLSVYVLVNAMYFLTFSLDQWQAVPAVVLLEIAAFVLAYDCAELVIMAFHDELVPPGIQSVKWPRVAVLYCTCDDVDSRALSSLRDLHYTNLEIFILDDSCTKSAQAIIDASALRVVRRTDRHGYKAGNLNHWLRNYSSGFDYFIVADADSVLPPTFVAMMVARAEHPANSNVGILESCVQSWNSTSNRFAQLLGYAAVLDRSYFLRAASYLRATLSVGHNNLYRTRCILEIGGFAEGYIAEDYATAIRVLQTQRWVCATADVTSFERSPENSVEYTRRQARWAYQTFQLLAIDGRGLPWPVALRIARAILCYTEPLLVVFGLAMFLAWNISHFDAYSAWWTDRNGSITFTYRLALLFALFACPLVGRLVLLRRYGVPIAEGVRSALLYAALACVSAWPIAKRLVFEMAGFHSGFNRTGRAISPTFLHIVRIGYPTHFAAWAILLSSVGVPNLLGWNLFWVAPAAVAPWVIWRYEQCKS